MPLIIAMLTLNDNAPISAAALLPALALDWPELAAGPAEEKENTLAFTLEGADVIIGHMPAPLPAGSLDEACATSLIWPEAASVLAGHASHLIVTLRSDQAPLAQAGLLTRVIASMIAASPAVSGVYWGEANLVAPPELFRRFAIEVLPSEAPLYMWVSLRCGSEGKGSTGYTRGLHALGLMDIEARGAPQPVPELRELLTNLASYLLENGLVINDGDTVGGSEQEKIRVAYGPSQFGAKQPVMRLVYEQARKPFWKVW